MPGDATSTVTPATSEAELRARLATAIEAKAEADIKFAAADAARRRAVHHLERCSTLLESFVDLDDEITAVTVAALRGGEGRRYLSDELRRRMAERDAAKVDLAAGERALAVLAAGSGRAHAEAAADQASEYRRRSGGPAHRESLRSRCPEAYQPTRSG